MLFMADDVELLSGILAALYLGAVPVPVSTMLTYTELRDLLADSRARLLCASTEFAETAAAAVALAPEITDVVFDGAVTVDLPGRIVVHEWNVLSSAEPVTAPYGTWADSPALWLYTSGTTGTPKAAMHRHQSIRLVAENYGRGVLNIHGDDKCLSVAKLFFAYGIGNSCFFPLSMGATTILERKRPTPASIAESLRTTRPTLFFAVPTFYSAMLAADIPSDTFSSVRQAVSAGEALPAVLYERVRRRFGIEVLDGIGSTEALHIYLSNRTGQVVPGSSGVPVPGYDVQLRNDNGLVIESAEQPGTLYLRGASIATGYWCRADTTRRVFEGEWLRTGDTYVKNRDGSYTCLGRTGDMLKVGGIWLSPNEVEARLLQHPHVTEAIVVAAPDVLGIEKPVACVVPEPGQPVDADELIEWCRQELAAFKRPRAVVFVDEIAKTATGKVRRNLLRERVSGVFKGSASRA